MKVALLSESPADEAGLRVLVEGVLARPVVVVQPPLRARGWPSVAQILPAVLRHLHFSTDTDGLVVLCDSDDTVVHTEAHDQPGYYNPNCRLCQLRATARRALKNVPPMHGRARIHTAIGVAVPAIEAWYLCGRDDSVTEKAWVAGQGNGVPPFSRRDLKERVYGTIHPSLQWETQRAIEEVRRHRGDLRRLEYDFPGGFGSLAHDLRGWGVPPARDGKSDPPGI